MAGETTAGTNNPEVNGGRQLSHELMREDHSMIDGEEKPSRYVKPKAPVITASTTISPRQVSYWHGDSEVYFIHTDASSINLSSISFYSCRLDRSIILRLN